jgi:DNA-binding NarL/FixJ family response regulator
MHASRDTNALGAPMPLTLVVADDAADYRAIVRAILRPFSDMVTIVGEAENGEQALALARLERPDLVITDLIMPRLNGIELTKRIRQELPYTSVILISSYTEDAYRLMASDSGADAFVSKQVITTSLLPAIRDIIRRRLSGGGGGSLPPFIGGSSASVLPP